MGKTHDPSTFLCMPVCTLHNQAYASYYSVTLSSLNCMMPTLQYSQTKDASSMTEVIHYLGTFRDNKRSPRIR